MRKETWKPNLDILESIITRKYEKSYDNRPSSTKNWIGCFRGTHYFEYSLCFCLCDWVLRLFVGKAIQKQVSKYSHDIKRSCKSQWFTPLPRPSGCFTNRFTTEISRFMVEVIEFCKIKGVKPIRSQLIHGNSVGDWSGKTYWRSCACYSTFSK